MEFKNNVTRLLDSKRIVYHVHVYDYDAGIHSAADVAGVIGLPPEQVYKTLVVLAKQAQQKPMLVIIPGPDSLDLKTLAKAVGVKKVRMASHAEAEELTKLQTGGISALALVNKGFAIYLSAQASRYSSIAVSAGQRGANIQLAVKDLVVITGARIIDFS